MATAVQEPVAARIAVATAKLTEYRRQCWRLAGLVRAGVIDRVTTGDALYEIAVVHGLVKAHGEDRIAILAEGFAGAEFKPLYNEAAA
jgi:hypothetical protein